MGVDVAISWNLWGGTGQIVREDQHYNHELCLQIHSCHCKIIVWMHTANEWWCYIIHWLGAYTKWSLLPSPTILFNMDEMFGEINIKKSWGTLSVKIIVTRLSKSLATLTLGSSKINQHCWRFHCSGVIAAPQIIGLISFCTADLSTITHFT